MRIKPSNNSISYCADTNTMNPLTGEYKDPLMKWPLRGAAFTNEVGEALRPVIGSCATLSWAPALLYIGADVYDKYKNNQTEYSPNSKRCLKQACFQGLASIILPVFAVKGGQKLFSLFGLKEKDKITYNAQEQINKLAQQFVANGKLRAYKDNDAACVNEFLEIVDNNVEYRMQMDYETNFLKKMFSFRRVNKKEYLDRYAKKTVLKAIGTRKLLLKPKEFVKDHCLYKTFQKAMELGQTKNVAVKNVINKLLDTKVMKGRLIKTIGGFVALGIAIKPIDTFVEEVLIGKVIGPGLERNKKENLLR